MLPKTSIDATAKSQMVNSFSFRSSFIFRACTKIASTKRKHIRFPISLQVGWNVKSPIKNLISSIAMGISIFSFFDRPLNVFIDDVEADTKRCATRFDLNSKSNETVKTQPHFILWSQVQCRFRFHQIRICAEVVTARNCGACEWQCPLLSLPSSFAFELWFNVWRNSFCLHFRNGVGYPVM